MSNYYPEGYRSLLITPDVKYLILSTGVKATVTKYTPDCGGFSVCATTELSNYSFTINGLYMEFAEYLAASPSVQEKHEHIYVTSFITSTKKTIIPKKKPVINCHLTGDIDNRTFASISAQRCNKYLPLAYEETIKSIKIGEKRFFNESDFMKIVERYNHLTEFNISIGKIDYKVHPVRLCDTDF